MRRTGAKSGLGRGRCALHEARGEEEEEHEEVDPEDAEDEA
jgi:hypothetical protein